MWEFITSLVDPSDFPARWYCGSWSDLHGWVHIISDLAIWGAYTAIPCILAYFISKRNELAFSTIFWLFCIFIFSCGTVHLIESIIFWYPIYRISAIVKVITAVVSWITVLSLIKVTPIALSFPGLAAVNDKLKKEIEERKRVTEDLLHSQDSLNLALQSSNAGIWSRDLITNQAHWNPTTFKIFDVPQSEGEISFDQFIELIHPEDRENVKHVYHNAICNHENYEIEFRIIKKNDNVRHLYAKGKVYYDNNDTPKLITGIVSDITEQKNQEKIQQEFNEQLQQAQKLESMGIMAGGIAHDFNNLLVGVLGNASLASAKLHTHSPVKEYIKQIEIAAKRASDLTKQMLAYSGKGKFSVSQINVNDLIIEINDLMKLSINKNAEIKLNLSSTISLIEGDHSQLTQIIMNLISNASDAIGDQLGTISITTGEMYCDRNYLNSTVYPQQLPEGDYVYFEVSDNGCGMNQETVDKIFDPFFTTKFIGRGLGLAAVIGIVRGHQGAIRVYSEVGKGTTIKAVFPISEKQKQTANVKQKQNAVDYSGKKVLLVDDEETVLLVVTSLLTHIGFEVLQAENGEKALSLFKENQDQIELVLLDLTMPGKSGDETFRELKQIYPNVKVIMSSGFNEQEVIQQFSGKGIAGFIQKPYTLDALKDVLSNVNF